VRRLPYTLFTLLAACSTLLFLATLIHQFASGPMTLWDALYARPRGRLVWIHWRQGDEVDLAIVRGWPVAECSIGRNHAPYLIGGATPATAVQPWSFAGLRGQTARRYTWYCNDGTSVHTDEVSTKGRTFGYQSGLMKYWSITLPTRLLVFAFSLLPLAWCALTITVLRRRRRALVGLCPTCGYDLRATPTRCPECGATPT
jgi:hypothetical protein